MHTLVVLAHYRTCHRVVVPYPCPTVNRQRSVNSTDFSPRDRTTVWRIEDPMYKPLMHAYALNCFSHCSSLPTAAVAGTRRDCV
jgi:hypothetical protein